MIFLVTPGFLLSAFLVFRGVFRVAIVIFLVAGQLSDLPSTLVYSILQRSGIFARRN
jgi:hypothetical protein